LDNPDAAGARDAGQRVDRRHVERDRDRGGRDAFAGQLVLGLARRAECRRVLAGGRSHKLWVIALGLRYVVLFAVVALLLRTGAAHPLGLVAGLSVLPPVVIILGLRAARSLV